MTPLDPQKAAVECAGVFLIALAVFTRPATLRVPMSLILFLVFAILDVFGGGHCNAAIEFVRLAHRDITPRRFAVHILLHLAAAFAAYQLASRILGARPAPPSAAPRPQSL